MPPETRKPAPKPLRQQVPLPSGDFAGMNESAWIEVIQSMDAIYADLVSNQVELEQKNTELEETQRFIDSVLEAMSDLLVVTDLSTTIQRVNPSLCELLKRPEHALLGRNLGELFSEDSAAIIGTFPERIRSQPIRDCELALVATGGKVVSIAVNCSARYDYRGGLSGMVLTGRPLGELQRAYQQLHQAHKELKAAQQQLVQSEKLASLGRLVAGVAHELNNPISFVFGNMHALKRYAGRLKEYMAAAEAGTPTAELEALRKRLKIDRIIQDIEPLMEGSLEGAGRISEIVQSLRRFATPQDAGEQWFDLVRVARSALQWVSKAAPRRMEFQVEGESELKVFGNEGHVHQILVNLLQNAVDASVEASAGIIELRLTRVDNRAEVAVRDHGPGIAPANLMRIFDPFFTTKPVGKGTGLGLYISYQLATEQCAGDLRVRTHPEGGAEFTLMLPLDIGESHAR